MVLMLCVCRCIMTGLRESDCNILRDAKSLLEFRGAERERTLSLLLIKFGANTAPDNIWN